VHQRRLKRKSTAALSTKRRDFRRISSIASGSSRRSLFKPTSTIGVPGHRSFTSSYHYLLEIESDEGEPLKKRSRGSRGH
jgi:hypothetical protein